MGGEHAQAVDIAPKNRPYTRGATGGPSPIMGGRMRLQNPIGETAGKLKLLDMQMKI
ncbi:MAG TPA: hypothetical protein VNY05_00790 [Candidatus Acidoferrales bacterium]|jgi:hypothetical protein|nr:hypothetical protein [Candidatus Acidoferrales bacterium]